MTSPSSSFLKPFLAGAFASAATLLIVQQLLFVSSKSTHRQRKQREQQRRRRERTQTDPSSTDTNTTRTSSQTQNADDILLDSPHLDMRMIRKAEGAIQKRTSRVSIVIERCTNDYNYSAILRTAEALGIQTIHIISPPTIRNDDDGNNYDDDKNRNKINNESEFLTSMKGTKVKQNPEEVETRKLHHLYAQRATEWLTVHEYSTTSECVAQLKDTGHVIWATDLSQGACCLTPQDLLKARQQQQSQSLDLNHLVPPKLAIVFGTEAVGCTHEMLQCADLRVYLPLRGFADSLNLSVATALVVHHLFLLDPSIEGDMLEEERDHLRKLWFPRLAKKRLESARQKKERVRLQSMLATAEEMARKSQKGQFMHPEQLAKISKIADIRRTLQEMDDKITKQAMDAVAELIENPPAPITDMRRPDEHRICFVGKNTKNRQGDVWNNMPATTRCTTDESSSTFFRSRAIEKKPKNEIRKG